MGVASLFLFGGSARLLAYPRLSLDALDEGFCPLHICSREQGYTYIHIHTLHMYISAHTIHTYMYASWVHSGARCVVKFSRRCILGGGGGMAIK